MAFAHLHVHTIYSPLDGLAQISDLYSRAREIGLQGIAITDHGFMRGVQQFMRQFEDGDIKPVAGCEIYLTDHYDHRIKDAEHKKYFHLILLAKNLVGYLNLCRIASEAATNGVFNGRPRVSHQIIEKYHEGIIALSACIGGEVPQAILEDNLPKAEAAIKWYRSVYGEDFYLEVSCHRSRKPYYKGGVTELQEKANAELFRLGEKFGIKVVATNDVHMVRHEDATAQEVLLCVNSGKTMKDEGRLIYTGEEYLKSEQEMLEVFPDHPEAISNTMEVLDKIEQYSIESPEILPVFPLPEGFKDENEYLKHLAMVGLDWRRSRTTNPEFGKRGEQERLDYELRVISDQGCAGYFLMIRDLIHNVKSKGHYVGIGRSTSPASLVCYVLGITDIDPLSEPFQLFERFINPEVKSFPGIEVDFDREGCRAAYSYLQHKYGSDHVSRMATSPRRSKRKAVSDALKAYGPKEATSIVGTLLHPEIHSCAVLLSDRPITDYIPMQVIRDDMTGEMEYVSQYDRVSRLGPVKLNLLVLHPLDIIREASEGIAFPDTFDDPEVFRLFSEGDTDDIFMFESEGMRRWLKKTKPTKFSELVDLYTMYRPGMMEHFEEYLENRERQRNGFGYIAPYDALCTCLEFTANTYGLPLYQEQILLIARHFGYTKAEASRFRLSFACLNPRLEDFGKLAYPLSHAASYVATAYRMAWLKVHHKEEFIKALNNADKLYR